MYDGGFVAAGSPLPAAPRMPELAEDVIHRLVEAVKTNCGNTAEG